MLNPIHYVAGSGQTVFTVTFPVMQPQDLKVYLTPVGESPSDAANILTYQTDYTFDPAYNQETAFPNGWTGSIVLNVPATENDIITLKRKTTTDPISIYSDSFPFGAQDLNTQAKQDSFAEQDSYDENSNITPHYQNTFQLLSGDLNIPQLPANHVWVKNNAGTDIIAVPFQTGGGGDAQLRAELASTSQAAPGTSIVGTNVPSASFSGTTTDFFRNVLWPYLLNLQQQINDLKKSPGFRTGDIKFTSRLDSGEIDGVWIPANYNIFAGGDFIPKYGTIGNTNSGASVRAYSDCYDLFTLWWNLGSLNVYPERGTDALSDWNNNCQIALPNVAGRSLSFTGSVSCLAFFENTDVDLVNNQITLNYPDYVSLFGSTPQFVGEGQQFGQAAVDDIIKFVVLSTSDVAPSPLVAGGQYYARTNADQFPGIDVPVTTLQFYSTMLDAINKTNVIVLTTTGSTSQMCLYNSAPNNNSGGGASNTGDCTTPDLANLATIGSNFIIQMGSQVGAHTHPYNTKSGTDPQTGSATECWTGDTEENTENNITPNPITFDLQTFYTPVVPAKIALNAYWKL